MNKLPKNNLFHNFDHKSLLTLKRRFFRKINQKKENYKQKQIIY